jgi:hypothetical protein
MSFDDHAEHPGTFQDAASFGSLDSAASSHTDPVASAAPEPDHGASLYEEFLLEVAKLGTQSGPMPPAASAATLDSHAGQPQASEASLTTPASAVPSAGQGTIPPGQASLPFSANELPAAPPNPDGSSPTMSQDDFNRFMSNDAESTQADLGFFRNG